MEAELRQYPFVVGLIFVTFGIQLAFLWTSHPGTVEKNKKNKNPQTRRFKHKVTASVPTLCICL